MASTTDIVRHNIDVVSNIVKFVNAKDIPNLFEALYEHYGVDLDYIISTECRKRLAKRGIICASHVEIPQMLDQLGVPPYFPENHFHTDGLICIEEEYESCSSRSERLAIEFKLDGFNDEYDPSYY